MLQLDLMKYKNNNKLNKRQQIIFGYIEESGSVQTNEILKYLLGNFNVTRMTVVRDLNKLVQDGYIKISGAGRNVSYHAVSGSTLIKNFDVEEYFSKQSILREVQEGFNNKIFIQFQNIDILSLSELDYLKQLNTKHETRILKFRHDNKTVMKRELERLIIDLAWKSSQIEGNTYTLFETEALLKEKVKASGKTELEATMILNHKKAVDFIMREQDYFNTITLKKIQELHSILVEDMGVQLGIRKGPVGITGTKYKPLSFESDIKIAMDNLVKTLNTLHNPFEKAIAALALIAYIQPFQDGNKRTSRLLANAILYANGMSMLSYSSADVVEYKKAMVLFYEQNSLYYLKEIFIQQYQFAVENYFI